jgi:hypothetical protein
MNSQTAARRAKAAHHIRDVVRLEARGHFPETELAGMQYQILR